MIRIFGVLKSWWRCTRPGYYIVKMVSPGLICVTVTLNSYLPCKAPPCPGEFHCWDIPTSCPAFQPPRPWCCWTLVAGCWPRSVSSSESDLGRQNRRHCHPPLWQGPPGVWVTNLIIFCPFTINDQPSVLSTLKKEWKRKLVATPGVHHFQDAFEVVVDLGDFLVWKQSRFVVWEDLHVGLGESVEELWEDPSPLVC